MARRLPGISSDTLIERLRNMRGSPRLPGSDKAAPFTQEEVEAILDARKRGVTWREINAMLPIPYANFRNLNTAIFRLAKIYGLR